MLVQIMLLKLLNGAFVENGFDATYGWESVMMEMFEELAPVLEDGSDLFINCDDGVDVLVIKDGKCIQEK